MLYFFNKRSIKGGKNIEEGACAIKEEYLYLYLLYTHFEIHMLLINVIRCLFLS